MRATLRPPLVDVALAVVLTVLTVATLLGVEHDRVGAGAVVLAVLSVAPLAMRQVAPVLTMLVVVVALAAYSLLGYGDVPSGAVGMVVAMFTVATLRPRAVAAALYPTTVVVSVLVYVSGDGVVWSQVAQAVLICLGAWVLGEGTRRWTERVRRAAVESERAVADERGRIAQELHDVVTHHMSVVALQTGVAEYVLDSDLETARRAIGDAGASSREALEEMRRMLDALKRSDRAAPYSPQPGLADVDGLADRMRGAGLEVEVERTGRPTALPPGLDLCAYRVVQESLTNVLRHAGASGARVLIDHSDHVLTVEVADDGGDPQAPWAPARATIRGTASGEGVRGMRERAELYGGTLAAGPAPTGGYAVVLRLPVPHAIDRHGALEQTR